MPSQQCQKNLIAQGGRYIYTHGDKTEILSTPYKEALPFLGVLAQRHTAVNEHSRGKTKKSNSYYAVYFRNQFIHLTGICSLQVI